MLKCRACYQGIEIKLRHLKTNWTYVQAYFFTKHPLFHTEQVVQTQHFRL